MVARGLASRQRLKLRPWCTAMHRVLRRQGIGFSTEIETLCQALRRANDIVRRQGIGFSTEIETRHHDCAPLAN